MGVSMAIVPPLVDDVAVSFLESLKKSKLVPYTKEQEERTNAFLAEMAADREGCIKRRCEEVPEFKAFHEACVAGEIKRQKEEIMRCNPTLSESEVAKLADEIIAKRKSKELYEVAEKEEWLAAHKEYGRYGFTLVYMRKMGLAV